MLVLAFLSVASAFAPVARHAAVRASTSVAMAPVEIAQSLDVVSQLPTELVSLEARRRVPGTAGEGRGSAARARRRRRPAGERLGPRGPNSTAETSQVTTAAFLAVLLGTFFPTFFLVTLYIQSEAYNARVRVRPSRARARTRAVRFSSRASRRRRPTPTRTSKRPTSPATFLCCGSPVLWVS